MKLIINISYTDGKITFLNGIDWRLNRAIIANNREIAWKYHAHSKKNGSRVYCLYALPSRKTSEKTSPLFWFELDLGSLFPLSCTGE